MFYIRNVFFKQTSQEPPEFADGRDTILRPWVARNKVFAGVLKQSTLDVLISCVAQLSIKGVLVFNDQLL